MSRPDAYPITYSVLGLLALWGPLSGYDLKRLFDHMLSPMWGAAHSQIYHELRRMAELGWVEMTREEQETRPDRKVYHITQTGNEALAAWQAQPSSTPQLRDELLLKVMFGSFATPADLIANLKQSIAEHEMRLLTYRQNTQYILTRGELLKEHRHNPYDAETQEDPFIGLITRFAIDFEKTYLNWLYETLTFLEKSGASEE